MEGSSLPTGLQNQQQDQQLSAHHQHKSTHKRKNKTTNPRNTGKHALDRLCSDSS